MKIMKFSTLTIILLSAATTFLIFQYSSKPPAEIQTPATISVNIVSDVIAHEELPESEDQPEIYNFDTNPDLVTIPNKINKEQAILLKYAYEVAKADGHKDPSVLQGLIWQESHAGGYPGYEVAGDEYGLAVGKRYYGVGQIKVAAARDVFKRFPGEFADIKDKTDEEIIVQLILDHKFNIRVASKYLWMMGQSSKPETYYRPTNFAITAYNQGVAGSRDLDYDNWYYTVAVHKHKDTFIKTFNLANNIK